MTCCTRPSRNDAYLCDHCANQLYQALGDIPWHLDELATSIARTTGIDYTTKGGTPSATRPLPYNPAAGDAARTITKALTKWVTFCRRAAVPHQGPTDNPTEEMTAVEMSRWLMWRVDGLALHPSGVGAANDFARALDKAQYAIDRPEDKEFYGPCEGCGHDLYGKPKSAEIVCLCGHKADTAERNKWMSAQIMGRLVTATEASGLLSRFGLQTSVQTVQRWGTEKRVETRGHRERAALYLFDDLVAYAAKKQKARDARSTEEAV